MRRSHFARGFSLIELLAAIGIIACLAGLLLPSVDTVRERADTVNCASNMHQIGLAAMLYAGDHDQRLPVIEPWPSQPVYSATDSAQSIGTALEAYGITDKTLTCNTDVKNDNYHAKEGSSYQWFPGASDQNIQAINLRFGAMPETITLNKLMLAFDYAEIHHNLANVLFGDGHVAGAVTH